MEFRKIQLWIASANLKIDLLQQASGLSHAHTGKVEVVEQVKAVQNSSNSFANHNGN